MICLILGLNIYGILIIKQEWLYNRKFFFLLFIFNFGLYIAGHLLEHFGIGDFKYESLLKIPFPQQALFLVLLIIHHALFPRDPGDTFWSMDWTKLKDRVFNFIFILLSVIPTGLALVNII